MNYLNGSILLFLGIFIGVFYKKLMHKLAVLVRSQKEEDMSKKDDDANSKKLKEGEDSNEEIDFEEEDLKMVISFN